ncbi:leukocyte receptor cluster (LRC) member 1 L homeolog [Xenopus laevis]|uniref:Leukocyte receptor cluster (LRC) member 1 L homeolog n=2 Tax=Xenopus laevis TaxID=8355 RepID=Q3KPQ3_XENLA|nr:leukocyte receptor cluster (LRC) member 1 L homeolog [Xenopus laevis]AAI06616.1 Unknown (protein for MGC:132068) [Xenopus laevis]OCT72940.1 hypothetical protein XELAEV_18035921mg [Xenopus laevis]
MNILPKKSWHVRNKDNVARVRKDEAQAAEEERVRRKRVELAEQEARTDFLRKKARLSLPDEYRSDGSSMVEHSRDSAHINFFQEVEEGKGTNKGNKEYEEEKRKEKERQEKALGILTYLGQSAAEAQTSRPWYQEVPGRNCKEKDDTAKDEKLKKLLDPLHNMEKYLQKKSGEKRKFKDEKQRKGKANESRPNKQSLEQMRQERLKREKAERARTEALLSGKKEPAAPEQEMDDRKRSYNSQFNPKLARKPKVREEQEWRY